VSATTRAPRPGEADGRDYRFVDRRRFEEMVRSGDMLEWAEVFGNLYGTPAQPVREALAAGRTIVLDIDVQGALQVHGKMPDATYILVLPPSREELVRRLVGRGTEDAGARERRLGAAEKEIAAAQASGVYNHQVLNDRLEQAVREVVGLIQAKAAGEPPGPDKEPSRK
jgi:guanylate kinase